MRSRYGRILLFISLILATGCGLDTPSVPDSGTDTAIVPDSAPGPVDTSADAVPEVSPVDTASPDTATADTASPDTASADTATIDTSSADTLVVDTAAGDTTPADTTVADTTPADTTVADTTPADTAVADTTPADTAVSDADSSEPLEDIASDAVADIAPDALSEDVMEDMIEDTGPAWPFSISEEVDPVWVETLDPTSATWVAVSLDGATVLAGDPTGLWVITDTGVVTLDVAESFDPITVSAAAGLPEGQFLIVADSGLYLVADGSVVSSPLSDVFADTGVMALQAGMVDGSLVLWIAAGDGLHYWKEGLIYAVSPEGLDTADPKLALTATGRLWVATADMLYRIEPTDDGFEAWVEQEEFPVEHLAADGLGNLWVTQGETVLLRTPEADWIDLTELGITHYSASTLSGQVWLSAEGTLMRLQDALLRPTDGPANISGAKTDVEGRLVLATPEGVVRVTPGRSVDLEGLPEDGPVIQELTLSVKPDAPELVTQVTVKVGGKPVALTPEWTFILAPLVYGSGPHTIVVTVTYSDIEIPTTASFSFTAMVPTWEGDIFPLAESKCGGCHGEKAAVKVKYYTKEQWISSYDAILFMVSWKGEVPPAMPPGAPLEPDLLELIVYWEAAGFL